MYMHVHLMVHGDDEHALLLRAGVALDTDDPRCAGPTGDRGSGIGDFKGGWYEHLVGKIYWAFSGLASLSGRAMPLRLAKRPAQGHRSGGQALPRRLDEALRA